MEDIIVEVKNDKNVRFNCFLYFYLEFNNEI